jgi:hypothetical protein
MYCVIVAGGGRDVRGKDKKGNSNNTKALGSCVYIDRGSAMVSVSHKLNNWSLCSLWLSASGPHLNNLET